MKKYFQDFVFGTIISFLFLVLPTIFAKGLIGFDFFSRFPTVIPTELAVLFTYMVLGLIPFSIYVSTPFYKKKHPKINLKIRFLSFTSFSFGIFLSFAFLILILSMAFTFSPSIS